MGTKAGCWMSGDVWVHAYRERDGFYTVWDVYGKKVTRSARWQHVKPDVRALMGSTRLVVRVRWVLDDEDFEEFQRLREVIGGFPEEDTRDMPEKRQEGEPPPRMG